jgi:outer membrane protein assembly factor BamB
MLAAMFVPDPRSLERAMKLRSFLALCLLAAGARAENWPQWRGPFLNGSTTETSLPTKFGPDQAVAWATTLPGPSGATPIVWGDHIFLPALDKETNDLVALCLDTKTGKVLWRKEVAENQRRFKNNTGASPSAVTDGKTVWFFFGTSDLLAFDFAGKLLWRRNLEDAHGHNANMFGYSSSPLLLDGTLFFVAIRNMRPSAYRSSQATEPTPSYLLAVDPKTGKDIWRHDRPVDARGEAQEAYSTLVPLQRGGRTELLAYGADYLTAHDPETGKETWRWGTYNPTKINHWRIIPSAVVGEGIVYVVGPKYSRMFAIRPADKGTVGRDHVAWTFDKLISDASTPLVYQGALYVVEDNRKVVSRLDPKTGRQIWQGKLDCRKVIRASLTGADGKLYIISEGGEVFVMAAGDRFELLHATNLGGARVRSSIVAAQGALLVRTDDTLFCFKE